MTPLGTLIHDTNSELSSLGYQIRKLIEWNENNFKILKDNNLELSSVPFVIIEYLKSGRTKLQDIIDKYYKIQSEKGEKLF